MGSTAFWIPALTVIFIYWVQHHWRNCFKRREVYASQNIAAIKIQRFSRGWIARKSLLGSYARVALCFSLFLYHLQLIFAFFMMQELFPFVKLVPSNAFMRTKMDASRAFNWGSFYILFLNCKFGGGIFQCKKRD